MDMKRLMLAWLVLAVGCDDGGGGGGAPPADAAPTMDARLTPDAASEPCHRDLHRTGGIGRNVRRQPHWPWLGVLDPSDWNRPGRAEIRCSGFRDLLGARDWICWRRNTFDALGDCLFLDSNPLAAR